MWSLNYQYEYERVPIVLDNQTCIKRRYIFGSGMPSDLDDKFSKQNIDFNAVNNREELHFGLFR